MGDWGNVVRRPRFFGFAVSVLPIGWLLSRKRQVEMISGVAAAQTTGRRYLAFNALRLCRRRMPGTGPAQFCLFVAV
jgi:hypothetical protein